jgi:arylsulfatase A-like enzyme
MVVMRIRQSFWSSLLRSEIKNIISSHPRLHAPAYILALLLIVCALASSGFAQTVPPDIIIILADDLGYGDVGFNGCPDYATPNIDSIASNGVLCTDGYVTHPFCSPSRAALLTGRYQQRFGHENQPVGDDTNPGLGLPMSELLLPQMLKPAGYVCGAIGKWHLGAAPNLLPTNRGFDEFFGFIYGSSNYYNAGVLRNTTRLTETDYLTDAFTREGVSFINRHATEPFFLFLGYNAVHAPYDIPPATYMDRVANIPDPNRRIYAAMVTALDDGVGQVLQTLQANNLLDKTLIFFLSDNGAPAASFTRNYPLQGYKFNVLEGGIRVPFAVQWTGRLPAHVVYDKPVSSLDIVATAAAAAGISLPADRVYDGLNIVPYLASEQVSPPRNLFWRWFGLGPTGPPGSFDTIWAVRSGPLKLVTERNTVGEPPALYNLPNDIGETLDLVMTHPGDVDSLTELYAQWITNLIPPLWQYATNEQISPLVLAGDWNNYNKTDFHVPWSLTRVSAPGVPSTPDGFNWSINTIHVAAAGGDTTPGLHSFTLVGNKSYSTQWGGVTINIDGMTSIPYFSGSVLGPGNSITLEDGFYYSFRILDWTFQIGNSLKLAVLKTSAPPVSVDRSGQIPITPSPDDSIVVNIVTSQPPSVEERIYLRWSTDFFITSHLVEATGSEVNYSATIPAQPAETAVEYSIITSTIDLSPFPTSGIIDALTLTASSPFKAVTSIATPTPTPTDTPTPTPTPTDTPTPAPTPTDTPTPTPTPTDTPTPTETPTPSETPTPTPSPTATPTPTPVPPSITTQPANRTVTVGQTAKFSVTATGGAPLLYQWRKNGANIVGASNSSYTTPATTAPDNGALYSVVVSNGGGSVTSNNATLTVKTPPSITTQPANKTVIVGQTAKFSVTATGTTPLSYQWRKNGVNITGATSASYITPATTTADNGALFSVVVTNSIGNVTSNNATLTVQTPPSITAQPVNTTVTVGQIATFNVTATGTAPLNYQWRKNRVNITGATSSFYTTPATTIADNGSLFSVVVSNSAGSVTSNSATLTVQTPPSITTQPANKTVIVGKTAKFSVTATGTAPLSCQWRKNGVNITGATSASYTTPPTTLADNGSLFSVVVSNSAGSVTSNNATLTVN